MRPVEELAELSELARALGHRESLLLRWCAQDLTGGSRAYTDGRITIAATPALCRHDRFCLVGPLSRQWPAYRLLADDLSGYRLLGTPEQVKALAQAAPRGDVRGQAGARLDVLGRWLAMSTRGPIPGGQQPVGAWLEDFTADSDAELAGFLDEQFPESYTQPGMAGVNRWLVARGSDGRISATAADCWSAPSLGYLGGVAVAAGTRGQGLGRGLCATMLRSLLRRHGQAWLFADADNPAAVGLYSSLGLDCFDVAAAELHP